MEELERGLSSLNLAVNPAARIGCPARAMRLQGRPDLNGREGVIDSWSAEKGRYAFTVDGSGEKVLLRPTNLDATDVVTALLDDDRQPRDWMHRGGLDEPASFGGLWRTPIDKGTPAAADSGDCQCGLPVCKQMIENGGRRVSCGICVADPVICWSCKKYFSLYCVGPGTNLFPAGAFQLGQTDVLSEDPTDITATGGVDESLKLIHWADCPRCGVALGAASMPTVFRHMLAMKVYSADGAVQNRNDNFKALRAEAQGAFRQAIEAQATDPTDKEKAIAACTRTISVANVIRSEHPHHFDGSVRQMVLRAHALRARLEDNHALKERLEAYFVEQEYDRQSWRFRDARVAGDMHLDLQEIRQSYTGAQLRQMLGPLAAEADQQRSRAMGMKPLSEDTTDWGYDRLDHECRELCFWVGQGRQNAMIQMWDFRWSFKSIAHAKDYFQVLRRVKSEEKNPPNAAVKLTNQTIAGLPADSDCIVLVGHSNVSGMSGMLGNTLFRVGRICGKVYVCFVHMQPRAGQQPPDTQPMLDLASRAVAKAWSAACEPRSVRA